MTFLLTVRTAYVDTILLFQTVMSGQALRDLNTLIRSEKKYECSSKGSLAKPYIENTNGNLEKRKSNVSATEMSINGSGDELANPVTEAGNAEVEYIESGKLNDVQDVDMTLKV